MSDLQARTPITTRFIAALFSFSMLLLATPALAQTVTAMWDPSSPVDHPTGYEVCLGTSSSSCNVGLVPVSGASTSYTFAPTGGVRHFVAIRATNGAGASSFSPEVNFSIPSFAQPANQSGMVGVAITPVSLSITDPDGSPLTISHTGLPLGLSINSATRQITGTPTAAGNLQRDACSSTMVSDVVAIFHLDSNGADPRISLAPTLTISSHTTGQAVTVASVMVYGEATDGGMAEPASRV